MNKRQETLERYLSDMLSVEKHIKEAVDDQLEKDVIAKFPAAQSLLRDIDSTLQIHISALEAQLQRFDGDSGGGIKDTLTALVGEAAGIVNKVRDARIATSLRDDYTALNLAAVSYTMLHTTALALKDQGIADLAVKNLKDLTPLITRVNEVITNVVAQEAPLDVDDADTTVGPQATKNTQAAWDSDHVHKGHAHTTSV